jgi:hypothetical protein
MVKVLSVGETALGLLVVGSNCCWPASFAIPNLGHVLACHFLDVGDSFEHVIKIRVHGTAILAARALPESKSIDHQDIRSLDHGISSSISNLIPTIRSANLDALGQLRLDSLNLSREFLAREVSAVQRLGPDGDGVNRVGVLARNIGDSFKIFVEGLFNVGPGTWTLVNLFLIYLNLYYYIPDSQHDLETL